MFFLSKVKVYNTTTDYWAINNTKMGQDTVEIVRFLLDRGITAMKIYPFNARGSYITSAEIERGLQWIRQIRDAAGSDMDICVDCWGKFDHRPNLGGSSKWLIITWSFPQEVKVNGHENRSGRLPRP